MVREAESRQRTFPPRWEDRLRSLLLPRPCCHVSDQDLDAANGFLERMD